MLSVGIIIVCAGRGRRLQNQAKAFLRVAGKPVLYYSLKAFLAREEVREIVLVLRKEHFGQAQAVARTLKAPRTRIVCVEGGKERQDSVYHGLKALDPQLEYVLVHDGARPFVSQEVIGRVVGALEKYPAVVCGLRARDTLKTVNPRDEVVATVDRKNFVAVQTPQGFRRNILMKAYRDYTGGVFFDDAQVVESCGTRVRVVEGDIRNFKITYPDDVALAQMIIKAL